MDVLFLEKVFALPRVPDKDVEFKSEQFIKIYFCNEILIYFSNIQLARS